MQYNHALQILPATAFFRFGGEFQYWHVNNGCSASGYANAGPLSGTPWWQPRPPPAIRTSALLGFGFTTGFTW